MKELIEMLEKMAKKSGMPNIAELSIAMEHQKHQLANDFAHDKPQYLSLLNLALVCQKNVLSLMCCLQDDNFKEQLKEFDDSLDSLKTNIRKFIKEAKASLKEKKKEDDNEEEESDD